MSTLETTTKMFRADGVRISGTSTEIHWESTGHLSVRLMDELGQVPLPDRTVKVPIPREGLVELVTDRDGKVFHPDVPFAEYELDLGEGVRVHAPAVANRKDVHERHVVGVRVAFANIALFDAAGDVVANTDVQFETPDGASFKAATDAAGMIEDHTPRLGGTYTLTCAAGTADSRLAGRLNGIAIVTLEQEEDA